MAYGETAAGAGSIRDDFDFMLGDWDVDVTHYSEDGAASRQLEGRWSAKASLGGRIIEDHFIQKVDGVDDAAAYSLRTYCEKTQRWEMLFLWAGQPATGLIGFVGNRVDNEMHLDLQQMGPDGMVILVRIRFFDITVDSFSWEDSMSRDNGVTWFPSLSLKLRRSAN